MAGTDVPPANAAAPARDAEQAIADFQQKFSTLTSTLGQVIVGHEDVIRQVLLGVFAGGHILLEGPPGIGKTLLVKTVARCLELDFTRIQFTPDLMPADVIGTQILTKTKDGSHRFEFQKGPIFGQIVLADEINRATPKTQSAMLEAMEEGSVTVARQRHVLPLPFFVLATQNPLEMEGTYPLPEAQIDRFLLKVKVGPSSADELEQILDRNAGLAPPQVNVVMSARSIIELQQLARNVVLASPLKSYIARVVSATHPTSEGAPATCRQFVKYGASPRGAIAIALAAKVSALAKGRAHVSVEDVHAVAFAALRHRMALTFEGVADEIEEETLISDVLEAVPAP